MAAAASCAEHQPGRHHAHEWPLEALFSLGGANESEIYRYCDVTHPRLFVVVWQWACRTRPLVMEPGLSELLRHWADGGERHPRNEARGAGV